VSFPVPPSQIAGCWLASNFPHHPDMHQQSARQLQQRLTSWSVDQVLDAATRFFSGGSGIYRAFPEKRGPTHVALRGQGGEEIVIGARAVDVGTAVSGSSYLFDQQVASFLDSLPGVIEAPAVDGSAVGGPTVVAALAGGSAA
jgi:hypothetical protein